MKIVYKNRDRTTTSMKNLALLSAIVLTTTSGLVFGTMQSASALTWNWNYSGTGIEAIGTFITENTPDDLGFYQILEINGTRNGETITGLQPVGTPIPGNEPFGVDNLISLNTQQLTVDGFGYSTSGGNYSSPFFASFLPTPSYLEVFSAPPFTTGSENFGSEDSELPISFSATIITVPEPTSILSLLALVTLGVPSALKRNKQSKLTQKKLEKVS
ncbi:MAG: PEP-CTERM sorting domain-containing protein [Nostoc sp. DedVER02]|uniref:PEP-CTERM sorting domain-containing protein n=1 Tax=unclassified Nostoc TaxID=2593658 RepID=UPI002AD36CA1|nr:MULTISPECIES: PEP-CTERM sorting domain-containing protein [unclassified Nostoc]MDZ7985240.1 PEP-CTERM sorting domain-containing protein [Nostoc sp. DedVER02]MDZ8115178.1 PEP-CTERM sorting domain-containing protein [Nostoc sp. DedVER01b]